MTEAKSLSSVFGTGKFNFILVESENETLVFNNGGLKYEFQTYLVLINLVVITMERNYKTDSF